MNAQVMTAVPLVEFDVLSWTQWQSAVLAILRADFAEVLHVIGMDEVDWESWRSFYMEGRTPKSAVDRALERDF